MNLRRKYVGVKEENDKLRNLLITAKKTGSAVPPVLLANHVQPQTNPTTLQPFLAGNVQRMEQVIQVMDLEHFLLAYTNWALDKSKCTCQ